MTIADTKRRELDACGTTGSSLFATTALALTLTLGQYTAFHISEKPPGTIRLAGTEGTVGKSYSVDINEIDILKQINRIHDNLLENQVELDYDSKHVLYSNLWNLYST
jgi:hypothetical protein